LRAHIQAEREISSPSRKRAFCMATKRLIVSFLYLKRHTQISDVTVDLSFCGDFSTKTKYHCNLRCF
jgi:hypothetical protein